MELLLGLALLDILACILNVSGLEVVVAVEQVLVLILSDMAVVVAVELALVDGLPLKL
jgi:hypothetical protein